MMRPATRNRLIIGTAATAAAIILGYNMFFSLTPPRHADHDHAMATLDAGGFMRIQALDGGLRNLVGQPGKVLVLHWFIPGGPDPSELMRAARFAASVAGDPMVDVVFVARVAAEQSSAGVAEPLGIAENQLYSDPDGKVANLIGVRRFPDTLIYDPKGLLAHQARGTNDWSRGMMLQRISRAKAGVEEIH